MRRTFVLGLVGIMGAACGVGDSNRGSNVNSGEADAGGATGGGATAGASGGSGTGGSGTGGSSTGGVDGSVCGGGVVRAKPTLPDMLIVLDRSGSMKDKDVNRWDPSVNAVKSMTEQLDDKIRFGLLLFPYSTNCAPNDLQCVADAAASDACRAGVVNVPAKIGTASEIAARLDGTEPRGGTPTGPSLEAALAALNPQAAGPGETPRPMYVLLVTDGQPTCPKGEGDKVTEDDIAQSSAAIDALLQKGVRTYVIGYDTKSDRTLAGVLDNFAAHGDTGTHRAVEDETSLLNEFQKITGELVSCTYELEMVPPDPSYVLVQLDGNQLNLNQTDGWSIKGATVTLEGQACKTLQDGNAHVLSVEVKCDLVPIVQ